MELARVVLADPPWKLAGGKSGKSGWSSSASPDAHYSLMTTEEICQLNVQPLIAKDAFLFLWVVNGMLPDGLSVMRRWGFRYVNNLCWRKTTGYGLGQYIRTDHELCLFGVRGRPGYRRDAAGKRVQVRSIIEAPRGKHSEKPEEIYRRIEKISQGPYLELFARKSQPGWECWGNEVQSTVIVPPPDQVEVALRS